MERGHRLFQRYSQPRHVPVPSTTIDTLNSKLDMVIARLDLIEQLLKGVKQ